MMLPKFKVLANALVPISCAALISGCQTLTLKNSQAKVADADSEEVRQTAAAGFYGMKIAAGNSLTNPCDDDWRRVSFSQTRAQAQDTAMENAGIGALSFLTFGTAIMGCGAPLPVAPVICGLGIAGAAFGLLTVVTIPASHATAFSSRETLAWTCE